MKGVCALERERERERDGVSERERKSRKRTDGRTDKGKRAYMQTGMCAKQRRPSLENRAVNNSV